MEFQRTQSFQDKSSHKSQPMTQSSVRPFEVPSQLMPQRQPTPEELENEAFDRDKFEAQKLQLKEKDGSLTPEEQERLGGAKAGMADFWARRMERAQRFGHNFANIPVTPPGEHDAPPMQPMDRLGIPGVPLGGQRSLLNSPQQSSASPLQAKLTIGPPEDKYEQEADRVASQIVEQINAPASAQPTQGQLVQLQEEEKQEEQKATYEISSLQRMEDAEDEDIQPQSIQKRGDAIGGGEASTDLDTAINRARGEGQPLDARLQQSMGQAMGADFSRVKVHTDAQSDQLNRLIQAKAFTTGQDVFFRQGAYDPEGRRGQELIAHELTHVVQQQGSLLQSPTIQRTLIPAAAKENALRTLAKEDPNALYMVNIIDTENWDNTTQEALLKEKDKEQLRTGVDLKKQLKVLGILRQFINDRPNFLSLFNMTLRNAVAAGKVGPVLYNDIKSPFGQMFKGNIEAVTTPEQLQSKLTEDALSDYLLRSGERSIAENAKFLRGNLGDRGDFAENMEDRLRKLKESDYLVYLERRLREVNKELDALTLKEGHSSLTPHEQEIKDILTKSKEKLEVRQTKEIESRRDPEQLADTKARINAERLKVLDDPKSKISNNVKNFITNYRVGEIGSFPSEITLDAGKQEKPPSDFSKDPAQADSVGYAVNIITGKGRTKPKEVAKQYYEEAFDTADFGGSQQKAAQVPYRMAMVIGINLFENLDAASDHKTAVKTFVDSEGVTDKFPMVSFGFTWRPRWQNKVGADVEIGTLREEFNRMNPAEKDLIRAYERQNVTRIQENIPYGRLRDTVTASTYTQKQVAFLSKHNKTVYIYSGDDDAPNLKVSPAAAISGAQGVFSRYDQVLQDLGRHPLMVIGGYQFAQGKTKLELNPDNPGEFLTYLADVLNQSIRKLLANGLSVYPTEPNLLVKAYESNPQGADYQLFENPTLFEGGEENKQLRKGQTLWGQGAAEGRALRENVLKAQGREITSADVAFDPRASVYTDPTRFKLSNEAPVPSKHYAFDENKRETFQEMRQRRGMDKKGFVDKKGFMAQLLADLVLQNQSMADRRTFAREVKNALQLKQLPGTAADILLENPSAKELRDAELTAIMIHNNQITQKIYELSGLKKTVELTYEEYVKYLRFKFDQPDHDEYSEVSVTVGTENITYSQTKSEQELPNKYKLKPEFAREASAMVERVMAGLTGLQVDGESLWEKLRTTMDKILESVHFDE